MNLFETRAGWPISPTPAPSLKVENIEVPPQTAVIPCAMVLPKQIGEKMYMGTTLPHLQKGKGRQHGGLVWQQADRSAQKSPSTKHTAPPSL